MPTKAVTFTVGADEAGLRLDQVLAARVEGLSRRRARVLLDLGGVFIDGRRVKIAARSMHEGEKVQAHLGGALERATKQLGGDARARDEAGLPRHTVVYEDEEVIVVDKPSGLLTAPTPESDRNNLAAILGEVFVVHRLDMETSGLLVFGKTPHANRVLGERFRTHDLLREYLAVLRGQVPDTLVRIDRPVGGKTAVTHLSVAERLAGATLVRARLETGRTHQVRLHCRAEGHPVLGDRRHGEPTDFDPPRMALHATRLELPHPRTGAPLAFESPWPTDLAAWLQGLR